MPHATHPLSWRYNRRSLLLGAGALAGGAVLSGLVGQRSAFAQGFPERNLNITVPTGEGGGADRDARAFTRIWANHLRTNFEFGYYPGAAGQVGYEFYMQREPDAYNLIFANLGPEVIMLEMQDAGIRVGEEIVYVQQTLSEPMALWVSAQSPIQSLEQLIEEARRRPVTVSTSRLPHPATIGVLALGDQLGVDFTLVPYGGGNPTAMAAITLEVDACTLPITNAIVLGDQVRILGVFANENVAPDQTGNAPTVNAALGTSLPELTSSRAWGLHRAALDRYPDRVERLLESMRATLADPAYVQAVEDAGVPSVFIDAGGQDVAMASAQSIAELTNRYRELLSGN